jgi:hypothetical protein
MIQNDRWPKAKVLFRQMLDEQGWFEPPAFKPLTTADEAERMASEEWDRQDRRFRAMTQPHPGAVFVSARHCTCNQPEEQPAPTEIMVLRARIQKLEAEAAMKDSVIRALKDGRELLQKVIGNLVSDLVDAKEV